MTIKGHLTGAYRAGHPVTKQAGWTITFEYDEDVIVALKAAVPMHERSWNPDKEEWFVAEPHENDVLRIFPAFESYLHQLSLFGPQS